MPERVCVLVLLSVLLVMPVVFIWMALEASLWQLTYVVVHVGAVLFRPVVRLRSVVYRQSTADIRVTRSRRWTGWSRPGREDLVRLSPRTFVVPEPAPRRKVVHARRPVVFYASS